MPCSINTQRSHVGRGLQVGTHTELTRLDGAVHGTRKLPTNNSAKRGQAL